MLLRDVRMDDLDVYIRMRCDPVMMAELGGPLPREGMVDKLTRDVRTAAEGAGWILMIEPEGTAPGTAAGSVTVWSHDDDGPLISEIGWMVLPEFQGRGIAKRAVRAVLERARDENRWGTIHAHPAVTNAASNGICRSVGFTLLGRKDVAFADRLLTVNHWVIDPATLG